MTPSLRLLLHTGREYWRVCHDTRRRVHQGTDEELKKTIPRNGLLTGEEIRKARVAKLQMRGIPENLIKSDAEGAVMVHAATHWVDSGLPQIELGHKFAAALMCSTVSEQLLQTVRRPWPGFMINLPTDLLHMWDHRQGKLVEIGKILCFTMERETGDWSYLAWDRNVDLTIFKYGMSAAELIPADFDDGHYFNPEHITDGDKRTMELVGRLVVTTCAAMMMKDVTLTERNPNVHREYEKKKTPLIGRMGEDPKLRVFTLGKPVNVDLRERVKQFSMGTRERSKLEAQRLVRGHIRAQHYGPRNASRVEAKWIEPYWRGPEDAPITVSPHMFKGDDGKGQGSSG